jgi:hypothetical protein
MFCYEIAIFLPTVFKDFGYNYIGIGSGLSTAFLTYPYILEFLFC